MLVAYKSHKLNNNKVFEKVDMFWMYQRHNGSSLLGAKNIKCAIKFVRALITKFSHNKILFNWKIAENKNILGMV